VGGACSTHGKYEKYIRYFFGKPEGNCHSEENGKMIIELSLEK